MKLRAQTNRISGCEQPSVPIFGKGNYPGEEKSKPASLYEPEQEEWWVTSLRMLKMVRLMPI